MCKGEGGREREGEREKKREREVKVVNTVST